MMNTDFFQKVRQATDMIYVSMRDKQVINCANTQLVQRLKRYGATWTINHSHCLCVPKNGTVAVTNI